MRSGTVRFVGMGEESGDQGILEFAEEPGGDRAAGDVLSLEVSALGHDSGEAALAGEKSVEQGIDDGAIDIEMEDS